jgi:hypothetical protein
MQIVPKDDTLVIEARVNPVDIDVVHPGLLAKVRLTALSRRRFPPLRARVLWVSADQITDTLEGSHYLVRLEILENPAKKLYGAKLYPGMFSEVTILTEQTTLMEVLMNPIKRVLSSAFRESWAAGEHPQHWIKDTEISGRWFPSGLFWWRRKDKKTGVNGSVASFEKEARQAYEEKFERKVVSVGHPAGKRKKSIRLFLEGGGSVIATQRGSTDHAELEINVLRALNAHDAPVPKILSFDGKLLFQEDLGTTRLSMALSTASPAKVEQPP